MGGCPDSSCGLTDWLLGLGSEEEREGGMGRTGHYACISLYVLEVGQFVESTQFLRQCWCSSCM